MALMIPGVGIVYVNNGTTLLVPGAGLVAGEPVVVSVVLGRRIYVMP